MDVLNGSMEENIMAAPGAAPRWMPTENILMESVSGASVLIPALSTTVLTSCKHLSVWLATVATIVLSTHTLISAPQRLFTRYTLHVN